MKYPTVVLREICESIQYGYTASALTEPIGPRFLRITDIVPERLDWDIVPFCAIEPEKLAKHRLRTGDIVIARTGATTGWAKFIKDPPEAVFASYLVRIRPSASVNARFLGFVLESSAYKQFIQQHMSGAAQPNANARVLTSFELPLPPLSTQEWIAAVLSAYNDLIENCQRRIRTLERIAHALYREWFVHFCFPNHENTPRVTSTLGSTPSGWEVMRVPECVSINPRISIPREGVKPFVPMGSLSNDSMVITDIESREGNSGAKFQNGDTLLARITPCLENGKTGFVQFLPDDAAVACGSTEFIVLRSLTLSPEFVYCLARSDEFRGIAIKSMSGASGRQRVQERCFDHFDIAQPPRALLDKFSAIVKPIFHLIQSLNLRSQTLRKTRDLLLPHLVAGRVERRAG